MEFQQLESNQNVELRSYRSSRCPSRSAASASRGRTTVSFVREPPYTGGGWGGFSRKGGGQVDEVEYLETVRPQLLEFEDGTQFNLTDLSDDDYYGM